MRITISLCAVFIPVLLMGGVVGRIFNEFAVVVTISIMASALISLTLTPMLAARLPASHGDEPAQKNLFERGFDRVLAGYRVLLDLCLRFHFVTFLVFLGSAVLTVHMFAAIPKGFFPTEDISQLNVSTEARQDISFEAISTSSTRPRRSCGARRRSCMSCRASALRMRQSLNQGRFFVELKPKAERAVRSTRCLRDLRRQLAQVPGLQSFITPSPEPAHRRRQSKSQYQFVVQGLDRAELERGRCASRTPWAARPLELHRRRRPIFRTPPCRRPSTVDKDKASALGISARTQLRSTLYTGFGTRQISTIYTTGDSYAVLMEFDPRRQWTADRLDLVRIRNVERQPRAARRPSRLSSARPARSRSTSSGSCRRSPSPSTPRRASRSATRCSGSRPSRRS